MDCDLDSSIPDWIIDHPESQTLFDQLNLDTSCAGKSLEYVCQHRGLSPPAVLEQLRQLIERP